ncbi:tfiih basal transcription factor complex p47 subunit [Phlyctema vagabunda]|uniref:General transcription and DNA repair factor IIH n=1 Tax=Phlyctema vagabunda TaxID=108571 RepID=A0ABR4PW28_9HELO
MADSDGEYEGSDDDIGAPPTSSRNAHGTRSTGPAAGSATRGGDSSGGNTRRRAAWEDIQRSWDNVVEGADGSINSAVEGLREAGKRKRLLKDTTPLQRGIIRHMILILDFSFAMVEKDLRPTRYLLTLRYAIEFITEYFEQNPISQLGILGMRDGLAVRVSDMSGNPAEHIERLRGWQKQEASGNPSLQNALEMSRAALFHAPSHGTREILIVFGALLTSDPGDIHDTIASLIADRIRVSIVGLAAQVAICAEICSKTNAGDDNNYSVALNEQHFRELVMAETTPPVTRTQKQSQSSLLMMGFPSRMSGAGKKVPKEIATQAGNGARPQGEVKGTSESGRYACEVCGNHFCIDCDVFAHEIIHNCPGCQSDTRGTIDDVVANGNGNGNGQRNGNGDAMVE